MTATRPLGNITRTASKFNDDIPVTVLKFALQSAARELIPQERIKVCLRYHKPDVTTITVNRHKTAKKAYFGGLMTCSSIWHCAVCAARISEVRRADLSRAVNAWNGGVMMVTYTASHKISTPLTEILNTVTDGVRAFKSGSKFQKMSEVYGWVGSVKSLEVTYGKNGWHPHCHELVFLNSPLGLKALDMLEVELKQHWINVLGRKGYVASTQNGLVVSDDKFDLDRYVAKFGHEPRMSKDEWKNKWTLAHEVTKAVVKKSKEGGRTPQQLLCDYICGDFEAGEAWREYALTFKGRKQLTWSPGMRHLLHLAIEKSDAEIAEEMPEDTEIYAKFTLDQWRQILRHDLRGEILNNAGWMSQHDFGNWMSGIMDNWTQLDS